MYELTCTTNSGDYTSRRNSQAEPASRSRLIALRGPCVGSPNSPCSGSLDHVSAGSALCSGSRRRGAENIRHDVQFDKTGDSDAEHQLQMNPAVPKNGP